MQFQINIMDVAIANRFLRALWAEIRNHFGPSGWHYRPFKIGRKQLIHVGALSIGNFGACEVKLSYVTKGSIKNLYFEFHEPVEGSVLKALADCVRKSQANIDLPNNFVYQVVIQSHGHGLSEYAGDKFRVYPSSQGYSFLAAEVSGYDEIDAKTVFQQKINSILDIFAVCTNTPFSYATTRRKHIRESVASGHVSGEAHSVYQQDREWFDGYPIHEDRLILPADALQLIDRILATTSQDDRLDTYLKACNLYHSARKLEAQFDATEDTRLLLLGTSHVEMCNVLYVSALEAISLLDGVNDRICESCGQKVYSISKRVVDMVERLNPQGALKEIVRKHYSARSTYLHVGNTQATYNYVGTSIPQLDTAGTMGMIQQTISVDIVLRETVSYILRKKLYEVT